MYAIIRTGGKQYRVAKESIIDVDLLPLEEGADLEINDVLFLKTGENDFKVGTPLIEGAKVTAKVVKSFKDKKVIVFKKKRRKGYRKTQGHRQQYTRIQITEIQG